MSITTSIALVNMSHRSSINLGVMILSCAFVISISAWSPTWGAQKGSAGATGDACTIDLPNGLKEPGKINSDGKCCSIFDLLRCYKANVKAQMGGKPKLPVLPLKTLKAN